MSLAADAPGGKTTAKDVSRTIRDYTVAQRDEATKSAKAALDDMDAGIRRLERKLEREWDQMDAAARKKARATLDALRRERNELAEWYGGLKYSSAEAWDEVKSGFAKSYDDLKGAFGKARKAF
jgi:acyl-CoA reductase-like NAD-dependent aldehyde dehydrogenase